MAKWSQINMQEANSPLMEQLIFFHDNTMIILIMITTLIAWIMIKMLFNKKINRFMMENQMIEIIWTILPTMILILIALPSLRILYMMDETKNPTITIKAIGHQWYWSYEYSDFKNIEFESYMKPTNEILKNEFRLLETDNRIVLPINNQIRILVTATDVLHSWTIPSLGIKIDAIPGRLNQGSMFINRPGLMYGQCSEICGANHSFMPITIESVTTKQFIEWLKNN
uniref:Cytochrome c oxidase subunit 2 n=3 Tax=Metrocoris TaxID=95673 RepID=A0AB38Z6C8_9HEMI|nr:cytochrome c oxidase subunit 2 [Metrocoris vietnamensis]YP_011010331.1 cytochrome c oxidase subunit 2 [Metrocoris quynhi]YP_011010409.1 cytochrome c oxidase subunit 2 [Metrocoris stranguloides]YP_011026024.1 cytochrome c oxidase subunit 2 [Metrocoris bilobatoides]WPW46933.1 cytochrome c oxidase subunit 2 [Metrocoris vietnamensis]WPW46946.1 cytochrome c oxidase subunit 2 [Metrocoris quynhi]WPW47024.1 cytochrome c oxidase subunit 2 [Metrocoris stranguloides]WQM87309.1 cytochrome c oxidase s